jgi:hypothetical protein
VLTVRPRSCAAVPIALVALLGALAPLPARADLHVWVDEEGRTHVSDDPARAPASRGPVGVDTLRSLWDDGFAGEPVVTPPGASGQDEDRTRRALRAALDDLAKGETARATAALEEVLRREPNRPEAHWYLSLLNGQRGRHDAAEAHLRSFLDVAGNRFPRWRASGERRLRRLEDEKRLLEPSSAGLRLVELDHPHFRVQLDDALRRQGSPDLARRVLRYLDEARHEVGSRLGSVPEEPTGVVLYGRASYRQAHRHRFSFQTVGFYDGRIHVVSAAHPAGELRTLLFHEYTHALFREATGGDRPFWLNEGLAELSERTSKGMAALTRSERALLRRQIEAGSWIPLRRLAPSFSGLDNAEARLAYLEATAAAAWLEANLDGAERGRLLRLLGAGSGDDEALRAVVGLDTAGVEAALQREIIARFPAL